MWGYCPIRRPSSTFMPFQCWSIYPTLRDQPHQKRSLYTAGLHSIHSSFHSRTGRPRSGRRQKTRWSDIFSLQRWQGNGLGWNFTDSFSTSNLCSTILNPGSASSAAKDLKRRKYSQLVADFELVPVAVETSGIIGSAGCSLLTYIGRRISKATNHSRHVLHLSTGFSCHHPRQRTGNSSLIREICTGVG